MLGITWTSTANAGPSGLAVRKPAPLGPAGSRPPLAVDVMPCISVKRRCETRRRCVFSALMESVLLGMRVAILPLAAETEVVPPRSFRRSTRSSVKGGAPCPRCRRRRGHGSTISRSGSFRVGWWIHARPTGCARPRRGGGNRTVTAPPTPTPVPSRFVVISRPSPRSDRQRNSERAEVRDSLNGGKRPRPERARRRVWAASDSPGTAAHEAAKPFPTGC